MAVSVTNFYLDDGDSTSRPNTTTSLDGSEIKIEIEESSNEELTSFGQYAFDSTPAKRIQFHPIHSDLLCCDSPEGLLQFQQHSTGSSTLDPSSTAVENRNTDVSKLYVKWNIDGTKLAAAYNDGNLARLAVWDYPSCKITYQTPLPFEYPRVEWNPFNPRVLAVYKWGSQTVHLIWLSDDSCSEFTIPNMNKYEDEEEEEDVDMDVYPEVRTVEWISKDRIIVAYETGSLKLYYTNGTKAPTFLKEFGYQGVVRNMSWSEKYQLLATGTYGGLLMVWKMDSCTPIYAYCANSRCYSLAWQPNSDFGGNTSSPLVAEGKTDSYPTLACGLENGTILVWAPFVIGNNFLFDPTYRLQHVGRVDKLSFSPDGKYLAALSFDKELYMWDTKTWTVVKAIPGKCREVSWNSSSNKLAIVTNQPDEKIPEFQLKLLEVQLNPTLGVQHDSTALCNQQDNSSYDTVIEIVEKMSI